MLILLRKVAWMMTDGEIWVFNFKQSLFLFVAHIALVNKAARRWIFGRVD